ncbi:unnamed protein product [Chironomus riparius]|uniref:Cysteine-rich PDZ-binding protein n=1 Tax=Chironomus riparius TaxID=315576 RepID=A0A9N9RIH0_9DIPT|nr:unnamed protein product [Chironomus riparius]
MVCEKCELKLKHVATADPFKKGNTLKEKAGTSSGRAINENKALSAKRYDPMTGIRKCRICQAKMHQEGAHYCQTCAFKKGICSMCGKKILNTKSYRQSTT